MSSVWPKVQVLAAKVLIFSDLYLTNKQTKKQVSCNTFPKTIIGNDSC